MFLDHSLTLDNFNPVKFLKEELKGDYSLIIESLELLEKNNYNVTDVEFVLTEDEQEDLKNQITALEREVLETSESLKKQKNWSKLIKYISTAGYIFAIALLLPVFPISILGIIIYLIGLTIIKLTAIAINNKEIEDLKEKLEVIQLNLKKALALPSLKNKEAQTKLVNLELDIEYLLKKAEKNK